MRVRLFIILLVALFSIGVRANAEIDIADELELERAEELVPEYLEELELSPTKTPSENSLSITEIFNTVLKHLFNVLASELSFTFFVLAVLVALAVFRSFIEGNDALNTAMGFISSAMVSALIIYHISNTLSKAVEYTDQLTVFMMGLLPYLTSISLVGGELSTSIVQKAILLSVVNILQIFLTKIALPVSKIAMSLSLVGYVSGVRLGSLSALISSVATKTVTICCGIMGAVLYFQNTVTTVTDSLALRSVKLAAGSFIPIVGSFVSEASGTLITGVRMVKSTFGVFAICVLIYISVRPIINFFIIKLSLRFSGVVAQLLGCDRESKLFSEISSVYNILSAIMIASACFFIFYIAVFIKSEVR